MTYEERAEKLSDRLKYLYSTKIVDTRTRALVEQVRQEYKEVSQTLFIDSILKEIELIENAGKDNES